jgi:hypothetical protein
LSGFKFVIKQEDGQEIKICPDGWPYSGKKIMLNVPEGYGIKCKAVIFPQSKVF